MRSPTHHIIQKFVLDLKIKGNKAHAYTLQQTLKTRVKDMAASQLDQAFSKLMGTDELLRIPRLEIDLGAISQENIETDFKKNCALAIESALEKVLLKERSKKKSHGGELATNLANHREPKAFTSLISIEEALAQQFYHFLDSGELKSWKKSWKDWEGLLLEKVITRKNKPFWEALQNILRHSPHALSRLKWQFSEAILKEIVVGLGLEVSPTFKLPIILDRKILEEHLHQLIGNDHTEASGKEKFFKPNEVPASLEDEEFIEKTSKTQSTPSGFQEHPRLTQSSNPFVGSQKKDSLEEAFIYINNAGLALVIPCIHPLFKQLGYLEPDGQFKDMNARNRAAQLLQYIATGLEEAPEFLLALNKIICGIPLDQPLPRFIQLSQAEREEAEAFLAAIITHVSKLKNTSVPGLRHSFLMREGKLMDRGTHWSLKVQSESYDPFLLDPLPWSLGFIKFKWMKKRIQVEWF